MTSPAKVSGPSKELIGLRIWRLMAERGITPTELAKRVGITKSAITHWTKGRSIPRDSERMNRLSEALGVPVETIYGRSGDEKSERDWLTRLRDEMTPEEATETLRHLAAIAPADLLKSLRITDKP